jgi:hypothetical protein
MSGKVGLTRIRLLLGRLMNGKISIFASLITSFPICWGKNLVKAEDSKA